MRIGCLQFAPQIGDVNNNMTRADAVLSRANPQRLDLLVLPELAFSGYNFSSLGHIGPYLENSGSGITSMWARTTARRYDCAVAVGYPEKVETERWPASPEYYNSAIVVNHGGETIGHYRKSFLYPRDETWASEGMDGFFGATLPGLGNVAMGIGMDINPYRFESPWNVWEFSNHVLHRRANLVILSMSWITSQDYNSYSRKPTSPDLGTLSYWVARFEPLIRAEDKGEVIVVIASRSGAEDNTIRPEGGVNIIYAGTSCVLGIEDGEVKVYGILGRGQKDLLVVDTRNPPQFKLVAEQDTPIYEDKAQRREAMSLDTEIHVPIGNVGPDTPYPTDDRSPLGLEAAFGEIKAVSPVEPLASHAFFSSSPSKRRASVTSSESTVTPIASTMSSPVSYLGQPTSPDSGKGGRSPVSSLGVPTSPDFVRHIRTPSDPSPTTQERLEKMLHIASVFDRQTELPSAVTPDSADSLTVNTDWDRSPNAFTSNQFINIIPPSPAVDNDSLHHRSNTLPFRIPKAPSNLRNETLRPENPPRGRRPSQPTATAITANKASQPPTLKAPQLPRSRNPSLTRPVQRQTTIASNTIVVETARAGFVVPVGAVQIRATARNPSAELHHAGMAARRARSVSPPPTPATALWMGEKSMWRESRLW